MHISPGNMPRQETAAMFLTPDDLTKDQKSIVRVMAEEELRATAERMGRTLTVAESRRTVDLLIEKALAYLPVEMMRPAIEDLGKSGKRVLLRHALNHEAVPLLSKMPSSVAPRTLRRASAPRGADVFRLNLTLSHDLDAKINDVGYRARATGGARLAKTEVIRAACRLLLELDVDLTGVKSEDDLLKRLRVAAGLGGKGKK